ncbi:MAG: TraR/DksA family transcriptional regulator [Frankiaceae bacterium]
MPQFAMSPERATEAQQLSKRDLETARWLLESHRDARLDQVAALALLPDENVPPGEILPGTGATSRDGLLQAALAVLEEIEFAIMRLDDGSYGCCVTCGAAIAAGYLMRAPHVQYCVGCVANR